jgi:hypothetical protein
VSEAVYLIRGSTSLHLNDRQKYLLLGATGTGLAPLRRLTQRGPQQDGDTDDNVYRLDPRIIQLVIGLFSDNRTAYWDDRDAIRRMLRPQTRTNPLYLRYVLPNGAIRQWDVETLEAAFDESDRSQFSHRIPVRLRAANPTCYDPTQQSVTFVAASVGGDAWHIPWSIPWGIGGATIVASTTITQAGDWYDQPIITITGPITDPTITNVTLGVSIDLDITLGSGETLTIDTRDGAKSIIDQTGANRISALTATSDLARFRLAPDPEAPSGANEITVSGTGAAAGITSVTITYYHRYTGI